MQKKKTAIITARIISSATPSASVGRAPAHRTTSERYLMKIVLDDIRRETHSARTQERQFVQYITQKNSVELRQEMNVLQKELDTMPAFLLYISPAAVAGVVSGYF